MVAQRTRGRREAEVDVVAQCFRVEIDRGRDRGIRRAQGAGALCHADSEHVRNAVVVDPCTPDLSVVEEAFGDLLRDDGLHGSVEVDAHMVAVGVHVRAIVERVELDTRPEPEAAVAQSLAGGARRVVGGVHDEDDAVGALHGELAGLVEAVALRHAELEVSRERDVVRERYGGLQEGGPFLGVVVGQPKDLATGVVGDGVADRRGTVVELQARHIGEIGVGEIDGGGHRGTGQQACGRDRGYEFRRSHRVVVVSGSERWRAAETRTVPDVSG